MRLTKVSQVLVQRGGLEYNIEITVVSRRLVQQTQVDKYFLGKLSEGSGSAHAGRRWNVKNCC